MTDRSDCAAVRLDLAGEIVGAAVAHVRLMILEAIIIDRPAELVIDLNAVSWLSAPGLAALVCGYVTAVDYGTSYRVVNAHAEVRRTMQATGTLDMLADSDDIAALLLALLFADPPV